MTYMIRYAHGQLDAGFATYEAAVAAVHIAYPNAVIRRAQ